jgi:hypothetical protein
VVVERVFVDAFSSSSPSRDPILVEDRSLILERVDIVFVVVVVVVVSTPFFFADFTAMILLLLLL